MKPDQDAFGQALYDYFNSGSGWEIVERSDGYIEGITAGTYFDPFDKWAPRQQEAMALVRGRVLDIGCGAARHSIYLQENGCRPTGIDVSPAAVEVAKLRGLDDARVVPITRVSSFLGEFDTILMMGNNFGLMGNPRRARWLLRRFRAMTPGDGRIVAEFTDPYQTSNPQHIAYVRENRRRGRMPGQLRLRIRYRNLKTPFFDYLFVSLPEMEDILSGSGWALRRLIGEGPTYVAIIERTS